MRSDSTSHERLRELAESKYRRNTLARLKREVFREVDLVGGFVADVGAPRWAVQKLVQPSFVATADGRDLRITFGG